MTENLTAKAPSGQRFAERRMRRLLRLACVCLSPVAVSLLILKFAPAPFFWVWLTWATFFWAAIFGVRGSWPRAILFNLGFVTILLAAAEAYVLAHEYAPAINSVGFIVPDDVLGWAPAKGTKCHAFKPGPPGLFHGPAGMLFDVDYTIAADGLRVAPLYRKEDLAGTVLFFGCSFTFGEGLQDNETLPYQVGVQSGGRYRTLNFGVGAYGPEQMLAAIEHGLVGRLVDTTPGYAYYVAIPDHVWRVAGKTPWDGGAPRYELDAGGTAQEAGHFENRQPLALRMGLGRRIESLLDKWATWRTLTMGNSRINDDDIRLYFAVVRRSQELLKARYPGIQFRVILWPYQNVAQQRATYEKLRDGFHRMGIPVDLVEDILPGYGNNRSPYILSSVDHHPNALANRLLGQYVLNQIAH